jgi:hypothetical protein
MEDKPMTDIPFASPDELWEMVQAFSRHADDLKAHLAAERETNKALNAENSGWLAVYQQLLSQIAALEAEISRLRLLIEARQGKSQSDLAN